MDLRATVAAASLLDGILAAFDSPPSTANIQALSLACPPAMVLAALEMLDNGEVGRISLPNGRVLCQVSGGSGAYTVHLDVPGGYCPCPAFSQLVLHSQDQIICKHLLAVRLAEVLDKFVDKSLGLNWVAGLSTRFATVIPT